MRQPYELSIALRYLRARGQDSFISFISLVSMVGIGLGVAVLIVVLSVMNGFEHELEQRILGMVSDATITGYQQPFDDWRGVRRQALGRDDIVAAAPFIEGQGMVVAGERLVGVNVRGVVPELETGVSRVGELTFAGSLGDLEPGAYRMLLGSSLAAELGVGVGDRVVLVIAQGTVTPAGLMPRMRAFTVAGLFEAGMYEYDRGLVFVNMEDARLLFRTVQDATGLRLAVRDLYLASQAATGLAVQLGGGYYVSDWTRQHRPFFRSISLTKTIMFVILSMVIGVAAFNIVSTLVMVVRDKRGDIAILRSFGATPRSIVGLFASQGTLIGILGTLFGIVFGVVIAGQLGAIVAFIESSMNVDLLAEDVYFISDLPTQVRPLEVVQIGLLAVALTVAATLYPAFSAAREPPAEALRYE